ncbi:hypothetical protein ACI7YW_16910 [Clostridium ljungdahlii]|uniref:hypothetical protein n=1 Tax=Clostridium ljungdahlii TaxID=1538 RepID=UPI003865F6D7
MKKNTPGKIKNNYELYMALGNGSIEINDAIILLNRINKKGIVIGNCCECKKYIEDTINKIKRDKNYINNSIEKPKNEENTVKYFENILQGELKINEEVLKISFKLKDGKKEKDNVELVRKIELPDNMLNNNIKMSDEFKSAIMNYLINMKSLSIFDTGLIQFFHPGGEHIVDKPCSKKNGKKVSYSDALIKGIDNGIMLWNDAPEHRRKYICCSGKYISHDKYDNEVLSEKTKILFWGEWEPQSKIICKPQLKIKHSSGSPQYIHEPYISRNIRLQNPKIFKIQIHMYLGKMNHMQIFIIAVVSKIVKKVQLICKS